MPRQFTAKSKDNDKTKKDQYKSFVNEPLDKFKKRILKSGDDPNLYEITNSDITIDDEGFLLIGKMMDLMGKLSGHVTDVKRIVQVTDAVEKLKKEAEANAEKADKAEAEMDKGVADAGDGESE